MAAPGYQRTGNSVVGPLPRPPLAGIGTSGGAARPEPAIGVKVAATTAVGTSSAPPLDLALEPRPSNVASAPAGVNVGTRKNTVVGFQQATVPGAQTPYEHGAKDDSSRSPQAFSDDFDDQPTLIGDSADLQPYLDAERRLEMGAAKPPAPVVPAADTFENAPRIRSSALGLLVPAEVIGTPRTSESDVLSDDDLVPAGSLPPLALPATSPHAVVPSALLESAPEPMMIVPSPAPVPQIQYQPPVAPPMQASSVYGAAANLPPRPVAQAAPQVHAAQPGQTAQPAQPGQPAFNSTVSGESTLIVRSRFSELEDAAQKPKRPIALYVVGGIVAIGLGTLFALVVTGKLTLPGGTPTTVVTTGAATTGRPTPPTPNTNVPPTTGSTTTAAATVDSGIAEVDAGVVAIVDAGFDAGAVVVAPPVEPPPVPVADPGDLSGITPDSQLPESGPRASDMLVDDAMRLMEQGRLDAANVALTRAMERDRINPQGYEAVAKLAIARRDFPAAIAAASHATELRPRDSRYYVVLGDAQLGAGDRAAAQASWQRAVSIDRNRDARARLEANP